MLQKKDKKSFGVLLVLTAVFLSFSCSTVAIEKQGSWSYIDPTERVEILSVKQSAPTKSAPQKVIMDSDMVEGFDDGVAMLMLDKAETIDLLGVTVVAGNTSMPNGVSSGVRQLEIVDSKTPIYEGSCVGIKPYRLDPEYMALEHLISPVISWGGYLQVALDPSLLSDITMDPFADWKDVYKEKYDREPVYPYVYGPSNPDSDGNKGAVDFLISQVNKYPGEIIVLAVGPATNIARAILKDPGFPSKVKEIVYMGGAFYMPGNSTAVSEFNWWADPEAAKIALRTQWGNPESVSYKAYGNQVISALEVSENTGGMTEEMYAKILDKTYPELRDLMLNTWGGDRAPANIWDVIAAAYVMDPSIVLSWNYNEIPECGYEEIWGVKVDMETGLNTDYGRSIAYEAGIEGPAGTKKAAIQNYIDVDRFWNEFVYQALMP